MERAGTQAGKAGRAVMLLFTTPPKLGGAGGERVRCSIPVCRAGIRRTLTTEVVKKLTLILRKPHLVLSILSRDAVLCLREDIEVEMS